jgi:hypothetical protein
LSIHPAIIALISSFLFGRTQSTRIGSTTSTALRITRSIIQGSGLGPILYIINGSDLVTKSIDNILIMYSDDTNLLRPETSQISMADEFDNILTWATNNKLTINKSKTKQLVFRRPNARSSVMPVCLPDIDLVDSVKILGVYMHCFFNQAEHVSFSFTCFSHK